MDIKQTCGNCKYADYSENGYSVCTNHDSPCCLDYVNYNGTCDMWEKNHKQSESINKENVKMTNYTLRQVLPLCAPREDSKVHLMIDTENDTVCLYIRRGNAEEVLSDKVLESRVSLIKAEDDELEIIVKMPTTSKMPITTADADSFF